MQSDSENGEKCAANRVSWKGSFYTVTVSHTLSDHRICHDVGPIGRHVKNGSFPYQAMHELHVNGQHY